MSNTLVTPECILKVAGREYLFEGNFATFKALQHALKKDVAEIQASVFTMPLCDFVALLHTLVKSAGGIATEDEIGNWLINDVGIDSPEYVMLRGEIVVFLTVAMSPRRDREKKKADMTEFLQSVKSAAFRGENTSASA